MKYQVTEKPTLKPGESLVVGLFDDFDIPKCVQESLKPHQHGLKRLAARLRKKADVLWLGDFEGASILLVHCGEAQYFSEQQLNQCLQNVMEALLRSPTTQATIAMPLLEQRDAAWQLQQMMLQVDGACYQCLDFKTKDKNEHLLTSVTFAIPNASKVDLSSAEAVAEGIRFSKTLANYPANICTPTYLAEQALELANQYKSLHANVLDESLMKQMGMGALLAVAKGSRQPPKLIEIHYSGAKKDAPPIVLVGKGITFDSGGLSLKPADAMTEMKYDMCGAACVLGTLKACALLNLPLNVIGLVACAENLPSGNAVKPGDVVTSLSGQTIEIINTDAEGRLVLADALTYATRFNPELVIDIATLTGAMVVALGHVYTGFLTDDEELARSIESAAKNSMDKAWRLPLDKAYQEAMDSPIADMVNASMDRTAGAITAASFLARFTESYRWAHLDIAGTAWVSGKKRTATGRPISLLVQLLNHVANSR